MRRILLPAAAAAILFSSILAHAEPKPINNLSFTDPNVKNNEVADLAGGPAAKISGTLALVNVGKTQALQFNNSGSVTINPDYHKAKLPQTDFTAEAWVRVDNVKRWGRIVGVFDRNEGQLKGWFLGFHENRFILSLYTRNPNPAPNGPKYISVLLHAPAPFHGGNWYHVAATYDGAEMRIYINGLLAAQSAEAKGAIEYPPQAAYNLGAFVDGADIDPFNGLLHEVKVYNAALSAADIAKHYNAKAELLDAAPPHLISGIFGSNMVLQRDQPLPVWGRIRPGEKIKVACGGSAAEATADKDGRWRLNLPAIKGGGPYEMTLETAGRKLTFRNVLAGEVWFCVGQSNLALETKGAVGRNQMPPLNDSQVRLFLVPREMSMQPEEFTGGWWEVGSPGAFMQFSAVASAFGLKIRPELNSPVGLLNASWGGTPAECWMSIESLKSSPNFAPILDRIKKGGGWQGTGHYNKMIAPLIPFGIRGVVWYQGENNFGRGYQYRTLFPTLIKDWRARWGEGDFPFYYVQIAPFKYGGDDPYGPWNIACAELWEAQIMTLALPNTGIVGTMDATFIGDNHASNKAVIGSRMALLALAKTYGKNTLVYSGPKFKSFKIEGDRVRISFDHIGGGLASRNSKPLDWFIVAGDDQKFHPATAEIDGETIIVRSPDVKKPAAVRFGWSAIAQPNFMNKDGLPALPFRTDNWPAVTAEYK